MEILQIQNEFSWVIKVLDSCVKEQQVTMTDKLFDRFLEKWKEFISDERKTRFSFIFDKAKKGKISEIRKNHLQLIRQNTFFEN